MALDPECAQCGTPAGCFMQPYHFATFTLSAAWTSLFKHPFSPSFHRREQQFLPCLLPHLALPILQHPCFVCLRTIVIIHRSYRTPCILVTGLPLPHTRLLAMPKKSSTRITPFTLRHHSRNSTHATTHHLPRSLG